MRFSKAVVRYRIPILIVTLALMIPAVLGMCGTRINYDMLDYLPDSMDTVIGQDQLLEDFGKGAFSFIVVENMPDRDVATLCEKIKGVEHVETVLWYSTLADLSVPKESCTGSSTPTMPRWSPCSSTAPPRRTSPWMPSGRSVP